jgi:hypothetical protein
MIDNDEKIIFDKVVDLIDIPEPDDLIKQKIMKLVCLLMVAKEVAVFNCSIPSILLDDIIYKEED